MSGEPHTEANVASQLRGLQLAERVREALNDRFELDVRDIVLSRADYPVDRLHDYLTGVADAHEPRVRLLFELYERRALDLTALLADVPATCFFLGSNSRYQRPLRDWIALLENVRRVAPRAHPATEREEVDLWSAGDLIWGRSRALAQDGADYLSIVLDRPVGLWRARVRPADLRPLAVDRWSGSEHGRIALAPTTLVGEQVAEGEALPLDVPLTPKPRVITEP